MVFQDYELIHTKRVNRERHGTNIYNKRLFNAIGGWNTLYFAAALGATGYQLKSACASQRHVLLWMAVPALVGYGLGIHLFGNPNEAYRMSMHFRAYQNEFANYKSELYYS